VDSAQVASRTSGKERGTSKSLDLHIHTYYSVDCLARPKRVLQEALRRRLDVVAITDHGSLRTFDVRSLRELQTIAGCEYATDFGDITGLFNKTHQPCRNVFQLIERLKEEKALVVLVHPYRGNHGGETRVRDVGDQCDLVEVWNSRSSRELNEKAMKLAHDLDKPILGGSDAHSLREIGSSRTVLESVNPAQPLYQQLLKNPRHLAISLTSNSQKRISRIIRSFREYQFGLTLELMFVHSIRSLHECLRR
jgi:predicted metal-dependent phosphoesterase TrpH